MWTPSMRCGTPVEGSEFLGLRPWRVKLRGRWTAGEIESRDCPAKMLTYFLSSYVKLLAATGLPPPPYPPSLEPHPPPVCVRI